MAIVSATIFFIVLTSQQPLPQSMDSNQTVQWTTNVKVNGPYLRGMMKNEYGQKIYGVYKIQSEEEKHYFSSRSLVGARYYAKGELVAPSKVNHRYAFNMATYLKNNDAIGIYEIEHLEMIGTDRSVLTFLSNQRFAIEQRIEHYFPESLRPEAKALIIGDQQDVDQQQQRAYQKLGITHLFAISGLHVALVSLLFQQLLLRIGIRREMVMLLLIVALPTYAIIAGGAPSVWRTVITVLILMLSKFLRLRLPLESALAVGFLLFVMWDAKIIYQIGFQLSFLAAFAIIFSARYLIRLTKWYSISLWITIACQLIVSPLLLYHFYEISLSSFVMNLIFVPLFSYVILPINLLLIVLTFAPTAIFNLFIQLYEPCRTLLTTAILFLQAQPYQMWNPGRPLTITAMFLMGSVLLFFYAFERAKGRKTAIILLFTVCLVLNIQPTRHNELRITFISVGQGDCTLIELPNRQAVYMIDSGGMLRFQKEEWTKSPNDYEVGRQVIVPYLKGKGITKIDKLILTHGDADHVEGAEEVMQEVAVKEIHITPQSGEEKVMEEVIGESKKRNIPILEKMAGEQWRQGGLQVEYVMPNDLSYEGNNDSLVLVLSFEGYKIIIPGDLEKGGESELVKTAPQSIGNSTILKAGHHGSKTSTSEEFLSVVSPKLVIYSTGENNRYNHPATEVVERVEEAGIPSMNTAEIGTIEVKINKGLYIETAEKKYELSR